MHKENKEKKNIKLTFQLGLNPDLLLVNNISTLWVGSLTILVKAIIKQKASLNEYI